MTSPVNGQESHALQELKRTLHYRPGDPVSALAIDAADIRDARDSAGTCAAPPTEYTTASERAIDVYLLRYLRQRQLSVSEAMAALQQRRTFEQSLVTLSIPPSAMLLLRSGRVAVTGVDTRGRPVLCVDCSNSTPPVAPARAEPTSSSPPPPYDAAEADVHGAAVMVLEYMQSLCMDAAADSDASRASRMSAATSSDTASPAAHSSPQPSHETPPAAAASPYHRQDFVLAMKDSRCVTGDDPDRSLWLSRAARLASLVSSYYPQLVASVWIIAHSASEQCRVRAQLANAPAELRALVHPLTAPELRAQVGAEALPADWGGCRTRTLADMHTDWADAVLRHWNALTCYLHAEAEQLRRNPGVPARSLLRPLPYLLRPPKRASALSSPASASTSFPTTRRDTDSRPHSAAAALYQAAAPDGGSDDSLNRSTGGELLYSIGSSYSPARAAVSHLDCCNPHR